MIREAQKACAKDDHDVRLSALCYDCAHKLIVQALRFQHGEYAVSLRKRIEEAKANVGTPQSYVDGLAEALNVISPKARQDRATCAACGKQKPKLGHCICGGVENEETARE